VKDRVLGLDGFKKRWLGVTLLDGRFHAARAFDSVLDALESEREASVVAIDIPIGLGDRDGRPADHEAKQFVGPRSSSVFLAFPEAVFAAASFAEAVLLARQLTGKGLSQQSYALRAKIKEAAIAAERDSRVFEVHPEVSFRSLAGAPLGFSKKSWNGLMERRRLLEAADISIPADLPADAGSAGADDVLDAAIAAWTARRIAQGKGRTLPVMAAEPTGRLTGMIWY